MKKQKLIVHFGAGALGRGLVVPMLYESGCRIVLADTNPELITEIRKTKSYTLDISDDKKQRLHRIEIEDIVSPVADEKLLLAYLKICDTVTTSVRRENLIHVARVLAKAWGGENCTQRMVLCCENVEGVGTCFKKLLESCADSEEKKKHLSEIRIPDTIVDRICASGNSILEITSETFHECSVDASVIPDTGITCIPSVMDIRSHFYRKRYLLNTYADTMAFLALSKGHTYLYEAALDKDIQTMIRPYIHLLMRQLKEAYGISITESERWFQLYRKRLSNPEIPRELHTVARGLWNKLTLSERFICPLVNLIHENIDVREGLSVIEGIIMSGTMDEQLTKEEIQKKLQELWCNSEDGIRLYTLYSHLN